MCAQRADTRVNTVTDTKANASVADISTNPFRKDFPLLVKNQELAFLDSAATSQRPSCVLDAQRNFYETMNANPLRGLYQLSVEATKAIDATRAHIARHIGATLGEEIIFTRNASEALNLCASCLGRSILHEGDQVVISIMEHHSNLIPWQQICQSTGAELVYLRPEKDGTICDEQIVRTIGGKTKIVALTHISNVLGVKTPIKKICARAAEVGAISVVDGAQSVPHLTVDVADIGCDLFAFSAHKLMGPMGIGVLWGKKEVLDALPPFLTGGEMISSVSETDAVWAPVPAKFEAGTQDAAGIYALDAALGYLESIGYDAIEERECNLVRYLYHELAQLNYINILGPAEPECHVGVVSFDVRGIHPHDVASLLDTRNVAIRAGHHCAQPLLSWLGYPSVCRASIALYNDAADIDKLVEGLDFVWGVFNHGH